MTWNFVRQKVNAKNLKSKTWQSDKARLLKIIDIVEEKRLDPTFAIDAPISNLRTIIHATKVALEENDIPTVDALFRRAAELPTAELRIQIGQSIRENVPYKEIVVKDELHVQLLLTRKQFQRIQKSTRPFFVFIKDH